jgi:hypothetical protein
MRGFGNIHKRLILVLLCGWVSALILAQTPYDSAYRDVAAQITEQVRLFTDRSIYAVDETIHFMAAYRVSGPVEENGWSSVLYVELITSGGQPVVQAKFPLSAGRAEGTLAIPEEALTGDYYLKSYTRWMRNQGPGSFHYTALKIINPYRSEVVMNPEAEGPESPARPAYYRKDLVACSVVPGPVQGGGEVRLLLDQTSALSGSTLRGCVTVIPEGALDPAGVSMLLPVAESDTFRVRFLPDMGSGVSISGTVVGPDQKPVPYTTLHISVLGEKPDYFATMSDEQGRFILSFPENLGEKREFFIAPEKDEVEGLEVRIDEEFDSRSVQLPGHAFRLNADEAEIARKTAMNMQLSRVFRHTDNATPKPGPDSVRREPVPFYGTRVNRLLIDDYIMLPNLKEIFINLVPEIQFYKKRGETRIRFLSDNNSIGVFSPLIMMDHVSVFDHQALLDLSPEKIERIDLINEIYLKGNVAFGGVLAIYSRKGDMAGIDLPNGSYFFDYQSFHPDDPVMLPATDQEGRIPDTRNTFFWQGDLALEPGIRKEITFPAPSHPGRYMVQVRGMLPGGELFSASTVFEVE